MIVTDRHGDATSSPLAVVYRQFEVKSAGYAAGPSGSVNHESCLQFELVERSTLLIDAQPATFLAVR